jgi:NitT/TauT family transport system ATP-binding protein/sulfonate transport system ATP-binding protein
VVTLTPPPAGTEGAALSAREVGKAFRTPDGSCVTALHGLSLEVPAGEMVALVGPSGCGKSTLLRLIAGLETPDSGDLRVGAEPITGPGAERGLMFQDPNLFPWLSVRGNVESGLVARGVLGGRRHEVDEFLKLMGLEGFAHLHPHQLSGGMAQRAALARALVNHPRVLLLDEPLGALDQFTRMRMQDEVLRVWQARRTTMVLVTHDIDEALYMSDRIALLTPRPGRVERLIDVTLPRPRQRSGSGFLEMRAALLEMLHLAGTAVCSGRR